ncbi:hypothetical protein HMI55_007295, partial [Coelomomyces lativittatus]
IPNSAYNENNKILELEGENKFKWHLNLERNDNLFSEDYAFYDFEFKPQASSVRNCFYHVRMKKND